MNKKKLLWISVLVVFIIAIIIIVAVVKPRDNSNTVSTVQRGDGTTSQNNVKEENKTQENNSKYTKKELSDGILYSTTGDKIKADLVIGDNYFDTTIADMMVNPSSYKGKKIEIEGMYISNLPYTFVGRYSTSNLCADCPVGYSYVEYELDGTIDAKLTDEKSWIKLVGTLETGTDNFGTKENPVYSEYYYLKVLSLQVMNERGKDTVNN